MSQDNQILSNEAPKASRRAILTAAPAAAAGALLAGTTVSAPAAALAKSDGLDWPAIILRAEGMTDRLQKYYGPDWTPGDQKAASGMLAYCRDRGAGLPDDETAWKATLEFFWEYGQSLDYVMYGNPVSMIARSAARSPRGRPAWEAEVDPIFAMIERHRGAVAEYNRAEAISGNIPGGSADWEAAWGRTSSAMDRSGDLLEALLCAEPTTMPGAIALLEYLVQDEFLGVDWGGPEDERETLLSTFNNVSCAERRRLAQDFPGHFATVLRNIIARGQA